MDPLGQYQRNTAPSSQHADASAQLRSRDGQVGPVDTCGQPVENLVELWIRFPHDDAVIHIWPTACGYCGAPRRTHVESGDSYPHCMHRDITHQNHLHANLSTYPPPLLLRRDPSLTWDGIEKHLPVVDNCTTIDHLDLCSPLATWSRCNNIPSDSRDRRPVAIQATTVALVRHASAQPLKSGLRHTSSDACAIIAESSM